MPRMHYPLVNFYFDVSFGSRRAVDASFQSISGLDVQFDTENFKEGGVNQYEHVMPTRSKYSDLVLKRAIVRPEEGSSDFILWIKDALQNFIFEPRNLDIRLLNDTGQPLLKWQVVHAWPKAWKVAELNAEKGEVLIETLELNYNRFILNPVNDNGN